MSPSSRPPLSIRQNAAAIKKYIGPFDGIPEWMYAGVYDWVEGRFTEDRWGWDETALRRTGQYFQSPIDWTSDEVVVEEILSRKLSDDTQGLDLLDYCLGELSPSDSWAKGVVSALQDILDTSWSAWTVGKDSKGRYCLERRVDATVAKAARREMTQPGNAATYLTTAWVNIYGRPPDPSAAYHNAVRAIEAAAHLVVTPDDQYPRIGKMAAALEHKPSKWTTSIGNVDIVREMMKAVASQQHDRHGRGDNDRPPNVSLPEAEVAVQFAVTLVHLFRSGAIRRDDERGP